MENSIEDSEQEVLFNRFMGTFIEGRDPRIDLEINALKELKGEYLEKAKTSILERLQKSPGSDPMLAARAINLTETIPLLQRWLEEIRINPTHEYRSTSVQGELAYTLYEFTKDISYAPDLIDYVKNEGYGEFANGIYMLSKLPLTPDGISAVWNKYKRGRRIKYPYSWRGSCQHFFQKKIDEPLVKDFLGSLPNEERAELLALISKSNSISNNHRNHLAKRGTEYALLNGSPIKGLRLKHILNGHTDQIRNIAWSHSGDYLVSTPSMYSREDNSIRTWNLSSGDEYKVLKRNAKERHSSYRVITASWLGKEKKIIAAYEYRGIQDKTSIVTWDLEKDKLSEPVYEKKEEKPFKDFICFPDGESLLISIPYRNEIILINLITQKTKHILSNFAGRVEAISSSTNGKMLGVAYQELKNPKTGNKYNHQLIYSGNIPPKILIFDVQTNRVLSRINTDHIRIPIHSGIGKICWMPNQTIFAAGSADNTISIWNAYSDQRIALLEGHAGDVIDLAFSADGKLLASKSYEDHLLCIWRTDTWQPIAQFYEPNVYGNVVAFHPTQPVLATLGNHGKSIRIWEFEYDDFFRNQPITNEL